MANDRMLPFLKVFYESLCATETSLPLFVIPFNDDFERMEAFCRENNIGIAPVSLVWDHVGGSIYGEEEYRPGIPSKNYFRKMNCFSGPLDEFVFFDVNSLVLEAPEVVFEIFESSCKDILFMTRSVKKRTLRDEGFAQFLNKISPGVRTGYNAGFFASKKNLIRESEAVVLSKNPSMRRVFGKAPEQGFINWAISVLGCSHSTINTVDPAFQSGFWKDKYKVDKKGGFYCFSEGPCEGQRVVVLKWTGQDLSDGQGGKNFHLVESMMR